MADVDFRKMLDKRTDQVTRPSPVPAGTYELMVLGYEFGESTLKKTPYVRFKFRPVSARADVDPADLEKIDLTKKELRDDFYITEAAEYRLVDFMKACGLNTEGRVISELLDEVKGSYVLGDVGITPNQKDPTAPGYNEVKSYAGVVPA